MRRFTQTFVLGQQNPKKYYVHNDIFRYQDEVFAEPGIENEIANEAGGLFSRHQLLYQSYDLEFNYLIINEFNYFCIVLLYWFVFGFHFRMNCLWPILP